MKCATFLLTLTSFWTLGQSDVQKMADQLKHVSDMPYICEIRDAVGCGDKTFWRVVQQKQNIVPVLIDMLADTTTTEATVPNFGGQWTVGDIAYAGLQEIIHGIPTFDLLGVKFDSEGCGFCAYWNHLRTDIRNRKKFQTSVRNWYAKNKANLVWVKSSEFETCDCGGNHPNGGHFEVKK